MNFNIVTLFPDMFRALRMGGVVGQAIAAGKLSVETLNPRQFTHDVHKTVDDRPYGGGDGMVMLYEPLKKSVEFLRAQNTLGKVIYLSPQGRVLNTEKAVELSRSTKPLTLICGRYGGIDQRFLNECVDEEISIGDYIVSGGELPAMVLIDAIARHIPGVLGHAESATRESFADGLLEAPLFTRPLNLSSTPEGADGMTVPKILAGGHHAHIEAFRRDLARVLTKIKRPDLKNSDEQLQVAVKRLLDLPEDELKACGLTRDQLQNLLHG